MTADGSHVEASDDVAVTIERSVLGHILLGDRPVVAAILERVTVEDFIVLAHRTVVTMISQALSDGKQRPSIDVVTVLMREANEISLSEIEPGLTMRAYVHGLVKGGIGNMIPWVDAVDALVDLSSWRRVVDLSDAMRRAHGSLPETIADVVRGLDDISARIRTQAITAYDAETAAEAAIAHLDAERRSITTGFRSIDAVVGGWPRAQLSIVAARPGMGKSAFLTSSSWRSARAGQPAIIFSLEMQREQLGARLLADVAYRRDSDPIHYEAILRQQAHDAGQKSRLAAAKQNLAGLRCRYEERRGLTLSEIVSRTRRYAGELNQTGERLAICLIDHIGLIRPSSRYAGNRERELAEISDGLATMAKELDIAVVALCQLNRGVEGRENKRPELSDLRGSGALEEDASLVIFLFRPAYYLEKSADGDAELARADALAALGNVLELGVAKNRNGRVATISMWIDIGANAIRSA
jgi:replicative DNA helicase